MQFIKQTMKALKNKLLETNMRLNVKIWTSDRDIDGVIWNTLFKENCLLGNFMQVGNN